MNKKLMLYVILAGIVLLGVLYGLSLFYVEEPNHNPCEYVCVSKGLNYTRTSGSRCYCMDCEEFTDEGQTYRACIENKFIIEIKR